jgi:hypothetical protein
MRIKTGVRNLYDLLTSLKLTAGLLTYFVVMLVIATFIPQGNTHLSSAAGAASTATVAGPAVPGAEAAADTTGTAAAPNSLFALLGLTNFFISVWFIVPLCLFFVNLLFCTIHRISGEWKNRHWKNYGPDIIHVGMLFLIISAAVSLFGRQEGRLVLAEGETGALPNGYKITLLSFRQELYADGSAREWRSEVRVSPPGEKERIENIRVNHPLSAGNLSLYQISYGQIPGLVLIDSDGNRYTLLPQEIIAGPDKTAQFIGIEQDKTSSLPLVIMELQGAEANGAGDTALPADGALDTDTAPQPGGNAQPDAAAAHPGRQTVVRRTFRPGDEILPGLLLKEAAFRFVSVIQAGYDPGFFPLMVSFFMAGAGLGITFYQRLHRKKKA